MNSILEYFMKETKGSVLTEKREEVMEKEPLRRGALEEKI